MANVEGKIIEAKFIKTHTYVIGPKERPVKKTVVDLMPQTRSGEYSGSLTLFLDENLTPKKTFDLINMLTSGALIELNYCRSGEGPCADWVVLECNLLRLIASASSAAD